MKVVYKSFDGVEFESAEKCKTWEESPAALTNFLRIVSRQEDSIKARMILSQYTLTLRSNPKVTFKLEDWK